MMGFSQICIGKLGLPPPPLVALVNTLVALVNTTRIVIGKINWINQWMGICRKLCKCKKNFYWLIFIGPKSCPVPPRKRVLTMLLLTFLSSVTINIK